MSEKITVVFHFIDGTKLGAQFPPRTTDPTRVMANIHKAMEADTFGLEIEGEMFMIPSHSVKYIHVSPAPESLPQEVIAGASFLYDPQPY